MDPSEYEPSWLDRPETFGIDDDFDDSRDYDLPTNNIEEAY